VLLGGLKLLGRDLEPLLFLAGRDRKQAKSSAAVLDVSHPLRKTGPGITILGSIDIELESEILIIQLRRLGIQKMDHPPCGNDGTPIYCVLYYSVLD
jgi:hypothetical protein